MRRGGGWILGLVVLVGMAATGVIGLRPILFRKKVTISFNRSVQWTPQESNAVRLAFEEKNFRAGSFRVEPAFVNQSRQEPRQLVIEHGGPEWGAVGPHDPPSNPRMLFLYPQDSQVGSQTARWARRAGIQRVFLLRSASFEAGFEREATAAGLQCRSDFQSEQGRSLVEGVLATDPQLVVLGHPVLPTVKAMRRSGYTGKFLSYDDDFDPKHYPGKQSAESEGLYCAASFTPVPSSPQAFAGLTEYNGYRMASLLMDAIERADSDSHAAIYRALAASPEFAADGSSTLPGGLYVLRNGALEFVEALK